MKVRRRVAAEHRSRRWRLQPISNQAGYRPHMPERMPGPAHLDAAGLARAARTLAARDEDLAGILERHGTPPLWDRPPGFATLVAIVLEQQVSLSSGAAALS